MPSVTNLSIVMTVDQKQFTYALNNAAERVETFGKKAQQAISNSGFAGKRTGMMFQEAARGVEDFLVSFQTGGIAGGLRGASNNLSQMASMLGPMAGAWVGIGAAISTVAIPALLRYVGATETAEQRTKALEEQVKRVIDAAKAAQEIRIKVADAGQVPDVAQARDERQALDAEIAKREDQLATVRRNIQRSKTAREQTLTGLGIDAAMINDASQTGWSSFMPAAFAQKLNALSQSVIKNVEVSDFWKKRLSPEGEGMLTRLQGFNPFALREQARRLGYANQQLPLQAQLGTEAEKIKAELSAMRLERNALATREGELAGNNIVMEFKSAMEDAKEFGRHLNDVFVRSNPLGQIVEADSERKTKLRTEEADLAVMLEQRKRLDEAKSKPKDEALNRAMLQKMDVQIQLQRDLIRELRGGGTVSVGGEGN